MFYKIIPSSWDYKQDEPVNQLIKVAHAGLRGYDLKCLVKRAGYAFADQMRRFPLQPGDVPVHNLALGATEYYGPNRNGDGFKEATSRKCHESFVKYARWYRHHQNKDVNKSYGLIKSSFYNPDMNRIELLIFLNGTKEAADRNKGLLADTELNLLNSGKDIPTSMACKVAYDVCAGCGNHARTRKEYCLGEDEGGHCKRGGCKNRLTMVHDDGFINHVENPDAAFFDMSLVHRGADRTSWAFGGVKAASAGLQPGGAELAELMGLTSAPVIMGDALSWPTDLEKLAHQLATIEASYDDLTEKQAECDAAFAEQVATTWNDHGTEPLRALGALSLWKVAMPIEGFVSLFDRKYDSATIKLAQRHLPGIYGRLLEAGQITDANLKPYTPVGTVPPALYKWASERAEGYSLEDRFLSQRVQLAAMYGLPAPTVNQPLQLKVAGAAESLARDYAFYKLAFLRGLSSRGEGSDLTSKMVVRQNYLH